MSNFDIVEYDKKRDKKSCITPLEGRRKQCYTYHVSL